MNADQMLDARDELQSGGAGASALVPCTQEEASHLRSWLFRNGIAVDVDLEASGQYRFTRREEDHARA